MPTAAARIYCTYAAKTNGFAGEAQKPTEDSNRFNTAAASESIPVRRRQSPESSWSSDRERRTLPQGTLGLFIMHHRHVFFPRNLFLENEICRGFRVLKNSTVTLHYITNF